MERYLSARQVRERYFPGLSRSAIYNLLDTGAIVSVRLGRKRLIAESALKTFMESHLQPAEQPARGRGASFPSLRNLQGAPRTLSITREASK